jgi:FANCI solenoid 4
VCEQVDLTAHLKMSTSRDFRINAASLQAAIERDEQPSDENEENEDDDDQCHNTSDNVTMTHDSR